MKEDYNTISLVLEKVKYHEHHWVICVDLKMEIFLLGQQSGYTKFPCFLCLWDSRDRSLDKKILAKQRKHGRWEKQYH